MRRKFDVEFKTIIVELLQSGKKVREVCDDYNLNDAVVRRWRREYSEKSGDMSKKRERTPEEIELRELRKELRETKLERDILKKAVGIFSKSDS